MRTPKICKTIQQLCHLVEDYTLNLIHVQTNHSDQDRLNLQDEMDEEF